MLIVPDLLIFGHCSYSVSAVASTTMACNRLAECTAVQALLLMAFKVPDIRVETHGALQVGILAVATGGTVQVCSAVQDFVPCDVEGRVDSVWQGRS